MENLKIFLSRKIFLGSQNEDESYIDGGILVGGGKILKVYKTFNEINSFLNLNQSIEKKFSVNVGSVISQTDFSTFYQNFAEKVGLWGKEEVFDCGENILMPGLVDSHVHVNEPGRTSWEGFQSATKAAAYGGYTTIVDMPLNSIPATTSLENLKIKLKYAQNKIHTDVAFWGGVVPNNFKEIRKMIEFGVVGFKCFLCPSGVDEFQHVELSDVEKALKEMENQETVLAFHAEFEGSCGCIITDRQENPTKFETFVKNRPSELELEAIKMIANLCEKYRNAKMHIVHLSSSKSLDVIRKCRNKFGNLSVETCHHYLTLESESVPDGHTEFKCCPPIGTKMNQERLWKALRDDEIDLVVSDHSPTTEEMKLLNDKEPDFLKAWGGISSLQFGLPLFWTQCLDHKLGIKDLHKLMSHYPAKLCGLGDRKGKIEEGYDADFCIWNPEEEFVVSRDIIQYKNKITPYFGMQLKGVVQATILRGNIIYEKENGFSSPIGEIVLRNQNSNNNFNSIIG